MAGRITAFMSALVAYEDGREEYGWVDPSWSRTTLYASRSDAGPILDVMDNDEFLADKVREILGDGSAYEDTGDGNFYGVDSEQSPETGAYWWYTVHFKRESGNGELPWHPVKDGGISLH